MITAALEKKAKSEGRRISTEVLRVMQDYTAAKQYHQRNIDNSFENWRFYYAKNPELGMGQYRLDVAQRLMSQNRALIQYNLCMPTVDALAGSLLQMKFDPAFIPVNAEMSSLTEAIQKAMYSDKELMDWNATFHELVVGGLVHEGAFKIIIDDRYSELGNIGIETCLPGSLIVDPDWKHQLSRYCKRTWHEVWLTAEEMCQKFKKNADYIQFYASRDKMQGRQYGTNAGVTPYAGEDSASGSKYKCIEEHCVEEKETKCSYLMHLEGQIEIPKLPDNDIPQWLDAHYPGWSPEYIFETTKKTKECHVRTACLQLVSEDLLEDGLSEVQIDATPFKIWSASRFNGEPHSIIDSIKDVQTNVNYLASMTMNKIQSEGVGGPQFIDDTLFQSPEEAKRFTRDRNISNAVFKMKPGYMERGITPNKPVISNAQFPAEAYQQLDRLINQFLPHISKVTPATLGRTETNNMPASLFAQLKQQSDIQAWTLHYGLRNFFNDFYEGYLLQASRTYSNELVERNFVVNGGREKITLNERIILEDGTEAIKNDASKLAEIRHKVIISEKPESPSENMANVGIFSELMQSLAPLPSAQATVALIKNKITENLYQFNSEDKEQMKEVGELELELAILQVQNQIAQGKIQLMQAQAQAMQMEQQMSMPQQPPMTPSAPGAQVQMPQSIQTQPQPTPAEQTAPQAQGVING